MMIQVIADGLAQQLLVDELQRAFNQNDISASEICVVSQWSDAQTAKHPPSDHSCNDLRIILDCCPDPAQWRPINQPGYHHVVIGGFKRGCLRPFNAASGVQEVAERCPHTDLAIVANRGPDSWTTLVHASLPTLSSWRQNQRQLTAATADYTALWLRHCQLARTLKGLGAPVTCVGLAQAKTSRWQKACIHVRRTADRIVSRIYHHFRRNRYWQIGWLDSNQPKAKNPKRLSSHGSTWFADPYVWTDQQQHHWILAEQFDEKSERGVGHVALFQINDQGSTYHGILLDEPFHVSFPRVIQSHDKLYFTVESCQNHDVRLYEAAAITEPWSLCRVLLEGEAFIDPVLLQHDDGRWYLFVSTTSVPSLKREVAPELRLFVCEDLFNGQFIEHIQSPLMISSRGGRNAGLLQLDQQLYRVGQQTGYGGVYGESIALFRIDELSVNSYQESPLQALPSGFQPCRLEANLRASHVHTLNNCGKVLVFDFIAI